MLETIAEGFAWLIILGMSSLLVIPVVSLCYTWVRIKMSEIVDGMG